MPGAGTGKREGWAGLGCAFSLGARILTGLTVPAPDPTPDDDPSRLHAQRTERRRIARLLHDTVSQSLTGTYLQAAVVAQKMRKDGSEGAGDVSRLVEMIHQVVLEMREITRQLTPEEATPSASDPEG